MSDAGRSTVLSVMLIVADARAALDWYRTALGAEQLWDLDGVAGLEINGAPFFLHEAVPGKPREGDPGAAGLTTTRIELFVDAPEEVIRRAADAGATAIDLPAVQDAPWGPHRQGGFTDPFGHRWSVGDASPLRRFGG